MPGRLSHCRSTRDGGFGGAGGPVRSPAPADAEGPRGLGPGDLDSRPDLSSDESLLVVLRGIGATMFLTSLRIIVARDGAERRPRSGVTAYPLSTIRQLKLELGRGPSGRIAVSTEGGREALSMFFDARSLDRAQEMIDVARPLIARQRRSPGDRPARPPSGPAGSGTTDPSA